MGTTKQDKKPSNPTGKGGFRDHPEHRSDGGWRAEDSINYQYNKFIRMTIEEFDTFKAIIETSKATKAQEMAYEAVIKAKAEYLYLKEITDRVEGKPKQTIDADITSTVVDSREVLNRIEEMSKKLNERNKTD